MSERNLLIISYHFPPRSFVGSLRVVKLCKYLPEHGYRTHVLTVSTTCKDLAGGAVHGAMDLADVWRRARDVWQGSTVGSAETPSIDTSRPHGGFQHGGRAGDRIKRFVTNVLMVPDKRVGWLPAAIARGLHLVRSRRIDAILSTSGPETCHLVGAALAHFTGKPWIADFRDGWVFEPLKGGLQDDGLRKRLEVRLEHSVVARADAVVTVSEPITEYFSGMPGMGNKCHTITNGFDPDDWAEATPAPRDPERFRIVHTGSFSLSRAGTDPRAFLRAAVEVSSRVGHPLEVVLVGALSAEEQRTVAGREYRDVATVTGWTSRGESLGYQLSSDVLLLITARSRGVATSKVYEYLYSGRPILALCDYDSAAARIVRDTGSGWVVDPDDSLSVAGQLERLYRAWQHGSLEAQSYGVEAYSWPYLARKYASLISELLC